MNVGELKQALDREGVKPHYYSLNSLSGGPYDGAFILESEGNKWLVYYYERGSKWDTITFNNEDEACKYMFQKLTKDPQSRIYNPPSKK